MGGEESCRVSHCEERRNVNRSVARNTEFEGEALDERHDGPAGGNRREPQPARGWRNPRRLLARRGVARAAAAARVCRQTGKRTGGRATAAARVGTWRSGDCPRIRERLVGRGAAAGGRAADLLRADERGPGS